MDLLKRNIFWVVLIVVFIITILAIFIFVTPLSNANSELERQVSTIERQAKSLINQPVPNDQTLDLAEQKYENWQEELAKSQEVLKEMSDTLHTGYFGTVKEGQQLPDAVVYKFKYEEAFDSLYDELRDIVPVERSVFPNRWNFGSEEPSKEEIQYTYVQYWFTKGLVDTLLENRADIGLKNIEYISVGQRQGGGQGMGAMMMYGGLGAGAGGAAGGVNPYAAGGAGTMGPTGAMTGYQGQSQRGTAAQSLIPPLRDNGRDYEFEIQLSFNFVNYPKLFEALFNARFYYEITSINFEREKNPASAEVLIPIVTMTIKGVAKDFDFTGKKR